MPRKRAKLQIATDPLCNSDVEIYEASSSEAEEFEDKEYEVEAVHGMEIDLQGNRRYEVEWKNWQRKDGSSTTWEHLLGDDNSYGVRGSFENRMSKKIAENARTSGYMSVTNLKPYLPHNMHTSEFYDAYEQKFGNWRGKESGHDWEAEIEKTRNRHVRQNTGRAPSEISSSSNKKRKRGTSVSSNGSHMSTSTMAGPSTRRAKRETSTLSADNDTTSPMSVRARLRSNNSNRFREKSWTPPLGDPLTLGHSWTKAARAAGAAIIEIVSDADGDCPQLSENFKYLERECRYGEGVDHPSEHECWMIGCACNDDCGGLLSCECQNITQIWDEEGERQRAYDDEGRFLFNNNGTEVIECNDKCNCSQHCKNRVAQKPRDVPLQIFKTELNGWGVRSRQRIPKGKVLGIYTGEIITREASDRIRVGSLEHKYLFDLDTRDGERGLKFYTVDATHYGNWTRYLNHSCDPVASIYSVVYDNILENNMPYLAVVANQIIEPYTEITFDYNPRGFTSTAITASEDICRCGSGNCRGRLF